MRCSICPALGGHRCDTTGASGAYLNGLSIISRGIDAMSRFSAGALAGKSYAREWAGVPAAIAAAADRMTGVTIEHQDWRRLIPRYDHADTCFYIDPPYPQSTRSSGGKGYTWEMSDGEHRQLAWMLHGLKGKVAISSYDCGLYNELYRDWIRHEKATRANGQKGAVSRTELLWVKPSP